MKHKTPNGLPNFMLSSVFGVFYTLLVRHEAECLFYMQILHKIYLKRKVSARRNLPIESVFLPSAAAASLPRHFKTTSFIPSYSDFPRPEAQTKHLTRSSATADISANR